MDGHHASAKIPTTPEQRSTVTGSYCMVPRLNALRYARVKADFPEVLRGDATRPERLSDRDPVAAYFSLR